MRVLGIIVGLLFLTACSARAQLNVRTIHQEYAFDPNGKLDVTTYKGSVTVSPWDLPQVLVHARIEADDYDGILMLPNINIRIAGSVYDLKVETDYREAVHRFKKLFSDEVNPVLPSVHYMIRMPRAATLKIDDYMSETHITDFEANLEVYTYKGNVEVTNFGGGLNLDTFMGKARVAFGRLVQDCVLSSHEGDVAIQLPSDAGVDLAIDLGTTEAVFAYEVGPADAEQGARIHHVLTKQNKAFQGPINGGGVRLSLTTYRGSLRLSKL